MRRRSTPTPFVTSGRASIKSCHLCQLRQAPAEGVRTSRPQSSVDITGFFGFWTKRALGTAGRSITRADAHGWSTSILVDRFEFLSIRREFQLMSCSPSQQRDATMKKLWLVAVAGLALSASAAGRPYHKALPPPPPPPPPACNPVASWTDVNASVCIKYVCAGGGFQIRCLPAPVLLPGPVPVH